MLDTSDQDGVHGIQVDLFDLVVRAQDVGVDGVLQMLSASFDHVIKLVPLS